MGASGSATTHHGLRVRNMGELPVSGAFVCDCGTCMQGAVCGYCAPPGSYAPPAALPAARLIRGAQSPSIQRAPASSTEAPPAISAQSSSDVELARLLAQVDRRLWWWRAAAVLIAVLNAISVAFQLGYLGP